MTKTKLQSIRREGDKVTVTLAADPAVKYASLERTALRHFTNWQKRNYDSLGYKSSEITNTFTCERDGQYYYSLTVRLTGLPTEIQGA